MERKKIRKKRKPKRNKPLLIFLLVLLVIVIGAGGVFAKMYFDVKGAINKTYETVERVEPTKRPNEEKAEISRGDSLSILLLGIDTGDLGRTEQGRSDTMMVATLNPKKEQTTLVSIPRDIYTEIVGKNYSDKLNHAYAYGGAAMSMASVENLLNIPIDHYAQLNMAGLKEMVDAVDGITVNSELEFTQDKIHFNKGANELDGNKALAFIRMRYDDPNGDFGRQKRQRDVIEATMKKLVSIDSLVRYQEILNTLSSNMKTDLTWEDIKGFVTNYRGAVSTVKQDQLQAPGELSDGSYGEKDIYYEHPTKEELNRVHELIMKELNLQ